MFDNPPPCPVEDVGTNVVGLAVDGKGVGDLDEGRRATPRTVAIEGAKVVGAPDRRTN